MTHTATHPSNAQGTLLRTQPVHNSDFTSCWVPNGAAVSLLEKVGEFARVKYQASEGWIRQTYLKPTFQPPFQPEVGAHSSGMTEGVQWNANLKRAIKDLLAGNRGIEIQRSVFTDELKVVFHFGNGSKITTAIIAVHQDHPPLVTIIEPKLHPNSPIGGGSIAVCHVKANFLPTPDGMLSLLVDMHDLLSGWPVVQGTNTREARWNEAKGVVTYHAKDWKYAGSGAVDQEPPRAAYLRSVMPVEGYVTFTLKKWVPTSNTFVPCQVTLLETTPMSKFIQDYELDRLLLVMEGVDTKLPRGNTTIKEAGIKEGSNVIADPKYNDGLCDR